MTFDQGQAVVQLVQELHDWGIGLLAVVCTGLFALLVVFVFGSARR